MHYCILAHLAAIIHQLAGSYLLVVLGLEDDRRCRVSAVVSERLCSISGSDAKIFQLRLGGRVRELHVERKDQA